MKKKLCTSIMLMLAGLGYLFTSHVQAAAMVYKMPQTLLKQLKLETEQRYRGECEQKKRELFSTDFYALNNDKLLILIGLPDYFCSASSFMPVTVDSKGHWEFGAVLESNPSFLLTDTVHHLWLVSHFEVEAVFPLLHHSTDGLHWQEISLPKSRGIDCCFEYIKQVCLVESQVQVKFTGIDDTPVEYWGTTVQDSLKGNAVWQKLTAPQLKNDQQCQTSPLTSGNWQRKTSANGTEIWFQLATQRITVIIPHWLK